MDWQRDDIECAIGAYVDVMDHELYGLLARGQGDFLLSHTRFGDDLMLAVERLETMLSL